MASFKKRILTALSVFSVLAVSAFTTSNLVGSVNPEYASKVEKTVVASISVDKTEAISFSWWLVTFDSNDDTKVWLWFNNWIKNLWAWFLFVLPYIWAFAGIVTAMALVIGLIYVWAKKLSSKRRRK